jgi:hypothetical protein
MKKIIAPILFFLLVTACTNKKGIPDVSDIKVAMPVYRFDKDLFSLDTNNLQEGLGKFSSNYSNIAPIFFGGILGLPVDSMGRLASTEGVKRFISLSQSIYKDVADKYKNFDPVQKEIEQAFRFVKHYFPNYKVPTITTIVGPPDALAQMKSGEPTPNFITDETLGISLQFYLGKNSPMYQEEYFIQNVAPLYRSRRFDKEYICSDVMKLVADDLYPDKSKTLPLIEQMVEKGKQWFILDKFMPLTADSVKTGYTQDQLNWCKEYEGKIWSHLVKNENLQSLTPAVIQAYLGEAPFTQGLSQQDSPGNIGQWIGWQIIKKYISKNPNITIDDLMKMPAAGIIEEAKYKPK